MKSLNILRSLLNDASLNCDVDTTRDWTTIQSRYEREGLSFLTITLPQFDSWLLEGLESGCATPSIWPAFRRRAGSKSILPCFLHGLTERVFDAKSGEIRCDADVAAIFYIRQICVAHKKLKVECTPKRVDKAFAGYRDIEVELSQSTKLELTGVQRAVAEFVGKRLQAFWSLSETCVPHHGPGATFERIKGNQKFVVRDWYERWDDVFSWEDLYGFSTDPLSGSSIKRNDELPVRVTQVPKTLKAPRIISVEPVAMQYAQQYVAERLRATLERTPIGSQVLFTNQRVHKFKALLGSIDRHCATIDLSEASDRVSNLLVLEIFRHCPEILRCLMATRSSKALMPDGTMLNLAKFASMGSATTFPVEAICFYVLAVAGVVEHEWSKISSWPEVHASMNTLGHWKVGSDGRSWRRVLEESTDTVFVYGDDIICPVESFSKVAESLESVGLKVNRKKSFHKGFFRESCGMDAYRSYDITPVYFRKPFPASFRDASEASSWVATSNLLYEKGCWRASQAARDELEQVLGPIPHVAKESSALGFWSFLGSRSVGRWNKKFFRFDVQGFTVSSKNRSDVIDGDAALLKHQLSTGVQEDGNHLKTSAERYSTRLKRKWVTI